MNRDRCRICGATYSRGSEHECAGSYVAGYAPAVVSRVRAPRVDPEEERKRKNREYMAQSRARKKAETEQ